jgi:enamine deaminase RidA (YjgF/YER057c/UK114 family)
MSPSARLAELGITLPDVVPPLAAYVPASRSGDLVFTAGQVPMRDGALMLNNFGSDGWELVAIHTNAQGGLVAFLKRPKQ